MFERPRRPAGGVKKVLSKLELSAWEDRHSFRHSCVSRSHFPSERQTMDERLTGRQSGESAGWEGQAARRPGRARELLLSIFLPSGHAPPAGWAWLSQRLARRSLRRVGARDADGDLPTHGGPPMTSPSHSCACPLHSRPATLRKSRRHHSRAAEARRQSMIGRYTANPSSHLAIPPDRRRRLKSSGCGITAFSQERSLPRDGFIY